MNAIQTTPKYTTARATMQIVASNARPRGRGTDDIDGQTLCILELAKPIITDRPAIDREVAASEAIDDLIADNLIDFGKVADPESIAIDAIDLLESAPGKFFVWLSWSGTEPAPDPDDLDEDSEYIGRDWETGEHLYRRRTGRHSTAIVAASEDDWKR